jgi:hypothetical protein
MTHRFFITPCEGFLAFDGQTVRTSTPAARACEIMFSATAAGKSDQKNRHALVQRAFISDGSGRPALRFPVRQIDLFGNTPSIGLFRYQHVRAARSSGNYQSEDTFVVNAIERSAQHRAVAKVSATTN